MASVELRNVSKIYSGTKKAVDSVSLTVQDREFMVLVGPSGCGKTTILRMVAGLEEITSGELLIDGRRVNDIAPKDRDIAMVFQNYALYPHMNVFENMSFGLKIRRYSREEIKKRVDEAAQILSIGALLDKKPRQLSGGERQRVAVGRAIVRKPKVFLFDEPLSNLDAQLRVQMRAEISALHTRLQATMLYVTHDQVEAMTMGDRIALLKQGTIQQIGAPLDLYNKPCNRFVAGFIGSPPMNLLEMTVCGEDETVTLVSGDLRLTIRDEDARRLLPLRDARVMVGIRPEDFFIASESDGANFIHARIEFIEQLGSECHLYLATSQDRLIAKACSAIGGKTGMDIYLKPVMEKLHFFRIETGEEIL